MLMDVQTLNTKKPVLALVLIVGFAATAAQADQICPAGMMPTTPTERFELHDDGTVSDPVTGLMWQRCIHGQSYNAATNSCTGTITNLNWQDSLQAAVASDYADYTDWRMPNVKELASLIEHACEQPAINLTVFPDTPGGTPDYWTGSVAPWGTSVWRVVFSRGFLSTSPPTGQLAGRAARFVRDMED